MAIIKRPMDIIKRRTGRQVRRPVDGVLPPDRDTAAAAKPVKIKKKRGVWKKLLIIFLILILLGAISALSGYFYLKSAPLTGEAKGRVNIMILGVDEAARLSDTLMILSLDTRAGLPPKMAMISIPRDLQVNIPGLGLSKINAAYSYGANNNYPGGGQALARKTVEENFDINIHYYAYLNFQGFAKLIDTVGGVDIELKTDLYDPEFPNSDYSGYSPLNIKAGKHHFNGRQALAVARCRKGTCGDDYGRAARQQQVILALKDKILNPQTLLNPEKVRTLLKVVEKNVKTDLSLRQMAKLYLIVRKIESGRITRHVIDSSNYLASTGGSTLVPRTGNFAEINNFIDKIFEQKKDNLPESQR